MPPMQTSWHLTGGRVVDPASGRDEIADLLIIDGKIAEITPGLDPDAPIIDARGLVIAPGLIDMHVHFREPGLTDAETIATGSAAAARGGFVSVVTMPNTVPATDSPAMIREAIEKGEAAGLVRVMPSGCVSLERLGRDQADLAGMVEAGASCFTDDGSTIDDEALLAKALATCRELGRIIMDHAVDSKLAARGIMRQGAVSQRLGFPGIPPEAEVVAVERNIRQARATGGHVHIQHMFAGATVEIIRQAKAEGVGISAEATPHHIALIDEDIDPENSFYKMNPPLGAREDRELIIEGLVSGTVEALATDHAPHLAAHKALGFRKAPFGILGLETAVGVTYTTLVKSGRMPLVDWLDRWTLGPARLLGLPQPSLAIGQPADIVVLDLDTEWTVRAEDFLSKSRNTPFEGMPFTGQAVYTLLEGKMTWSRHMPAALFRTEARRRSLAASSH